MTRKVTDLAASVRDRLLQRAHRVGEDFQLTLQRYAVERLLFRLSQSADRDNFVLKGAMLYVVWGGEVYRPTRDLDLLGYGASAAESVADRFRTLCGVAVPEDGLKFLSDTVQAEPIRELSEHGGVRVRLEARLAAAHIRVQVDVGFGDVVFPAPEETTFPALLEGPAPRIRAYTRESVVAEKLHAAIWLGEANTRLKDFYDLFALSAAFSLRGLHWFVPLASPSSSVKPCCPSSSHCRRPFSRIKGATVSGGPTSPRTACARRLRASLLWEKPCVHSYLAPMTRFSRAPRFQRPGFPEDRGLENRKG